MSELVFSKAHYAELELTRTSTIKRYTRDSYEEKFHNPLAD